MRSRSVLMGVTVMALVVAVPAAGVAAAQTKRISVKTNGAQATDASAEADISKTGRFIAFESEAANLVGSDNNGTVDCFIRDQKKKTTTRVGIANDEDEGIGECSGPVVSANGRFVAFDSTAGNLVGGDDNGTWDVFVRDRWSGTTERVSVKSDGTQGNGSSRDPSISDDGRFVAFHSSASNLVGDDINAVRDVFVHDRDSGSTTRVSLPSGGTNTGGSADPDVSAGGRYVVFESSSQLVSKDKNTLWDIYLHDRQANKTYLVSKKKDGKPGNNHSVNAVVSANGRYVAFDSGATNFVGGDSNGKRDVFRRDRTANKLTRLSVSSSERQANGASGDPSISANGAWITFTSSATNLIGGDTNKKPDVYLRNLKTGTTKRLSVKSAGGQATGGYSRDSSLSPDGRYVAFEAKAKNLVSGDTNGDQDVFRRGAIR